MRQDEITIRHVLLYMYIGKMSSLRSRKIRFGEVYCIPHPQTLLIATKDMIYLLRDMRNKKIAKGALIPCLYGG